MYEFEKLNKMKKEDLKEIASELNIPKISALKKIDIINAIIESQKNIKEETDYKEEIDISEKNEPAQKKRERPSDVTEICGVLEVVNESYGFLRFDNFSASNKDIYVSPTQIRRFNLKTGDEIVGDCRMVEDSTKSSPLLFVRRINGDPLEIALKRKPFEKLTPVFPIEKIKLETDRQKYATRLMDIISPIGKGQRGMIVAPPKAGKTTIIKEIAGAIRKNHPDIKLIILLIDERPEEVTDIKKSIDCDVIYSTFDQMPENHCKMAELVLERAQRLVEQKKDVVVLLDSITRLVRAYNLTEQPSGRSLSGGLEPHALYKPKKFFGAARKIEDGGSFTVIATALVETGSRMDDMIFEEFKGTGNMELKLDRMLQERSIFPAIDVLRSGTRRDEKLLTPIEQKAGRAIRRELGKENLNQYVKILQLLERTENNSDFIKLLMQ
ncbi:MAG: transcription termination factor Rho [Clostridiales bacterium]|nr:transcription termination factor Rho [Clostridiales bacterium]